MIRRCSLIVVAMVLMQAGDAEALDRVVLKRGGTEQTLEGRIVVEAVDGGVLLETRDGTLWIIQPDEQGGKSRDEVPFTFHAPDEAAAALKAKLPPGFEVYQTKHYVLCFNTSRAYAQWCGSLFERLFQGFQNYWTNRGFELHEPESPLLAVVFADRASYARFAQPELGDGVNAIIGYYSLQTNRMTMYDLTGTAGTAGEKGSTQLIARTLSQPEAAKTIATIVHEATHQIAFNCGLHRRYADIPLWVSEGVAVYFETPDLSSSKGWSTIGAVNRARLLTFRTYAQRRPADSLETLVRDDARMRGAGAAEAYAEAWALNYFLMQARTKAYREYMQALAEKTPLSAVSPEERLAEFRNAFGDDLTALDREFLKFMGRVK